MARRRKRKRLERGGARPDQATLDRFNAEPGARGRALMELDFSDFDACVRFYERFGVNADEMAMMSSSQPVGDERLNRLAARSWTVWENRGTFVV